LLLQQVPTAPSQNNASTAARTWCQAVRYADLESKGIDFEQDKMEAPLIVRWSTELQAVVERANTLHGSVWPQTLLQSRRGKPPDHGPL
jgi:hypothetical protein